MSYFLIRSTDDGTYIREVNIDKFLADLTENEETPNFFKTLPEDSDFNYWERGYLLIKGEIVVPRPVEVVTKYEV